MVYSTEFVAAVYHVDTLLNPTATVSFATRARLAHKKKTRRRTRVCRDTPQRASLTLAELVASAQHCSVNDISTCPTRDCDVDLRTLNSDEEHINSKKKAAAVEEHVMQHGKSMRHSTKKFEYGYNELVAHIDKTHKLRGMANRKAVTNIMRCSRRLLRPSRIYFSR